MTIAVDLGRKSTKTNKQNYSYFPVGTLCMLHYRSGLCWRMMIGSGWFPIGQYGPLKPCYCLNDMSSGYRISQTRKEIVSEQAMI